jgi:hypothetical protein
VSLADEVLAHPEGSVRAALDALNAAYAARTVGLDHAGADYHVAVAQVHATLALAAATHVAGGRR